VLSPSEPANEGKRGKTNRKVDQKAEIELKELVPQALRQAGLKYKEMDGIAGHDGEQAVEPVGANDC
jgi:hypothetical protein